MINFRLSTYSLFNLIWNNFDSVDCALDLIDSGSVVDGPRGQASRGRFTLLKNSVYFSAFSVHTSENVSIFVYNITYFKEQ